MKTLKLLSICFFLSSNIFAQAPFNMQWGSYTQDFDGLANSGTTSSLLPAGWGIRETGSAANNTYGISTGSSTTGDTYSYGATNSTDRALGALQTGNLVPSFGFGFQNNTGYTLTSIQIAATMEQWRVSNTVGRDSCYLYYSTNADSLADPSATWVRVASLDLFSAVDPTSGGTLDGSLAINQLPVLGTITVNVAVGATVFFKWVDVNIAGSDDGLAVDDVSLTLYSATGPLPAGPLTVVSKLPMHNNLNVPFTTTVLSFTFSDSVTQLGAGNIYIKDLSNSANDVTVPASALQHNGAVFTYSSLALLPNTMYAIQIDSNVFFNGNVSFAGIYNIVEWNFRTVAVPTTVTSLYETFGSCSNPAFGVFTSFSEFGAQEWQCTTAGHNDTAAVLMNGLSAGPKANEDWLISPPIDVSGMNAPYLHFWSKARFPALTTKEILVSHDYIGIGSPASATWNALQVNNFAILATFWQHYSNTDLSPYQAAPFYLAFRYESDTTKADEWSLDDILLTDGPLSIGTFSSSDLMIKVFGDVHGTLQLLSSSSKDRLLDYTMLDMAGRSITAGKIHLQKGNHQSQININTLNSGMYLLYLNGEEAKTTIKFMVR